jgi:TolB-like protein/tetratricopeptide (TPR) repeat protein
MPVPASTPGTIQFDKYEVDLSAGHLLKQGVKVRLREQSFVVLAMLLEHPGEVVTREQLRRRLWSEDTFVDFDNNLNTAVARLRVALNDPAEHPRFIETLPKRGYRFIGEVHPVYPAAEQVLPRRPRLVVLPFMNLSGDSAEEYFSDAMTDEIITAVARVAPERLAVIARTTAMHYKGSRKDIARIGRELNVDYVVEGGVRRTADQVAINVQLIQTGDQAHVFANKYDAGMRDIFSIQRSIAQAIAAQIPCVAAGSGTGVVPGGPAKRKPTEDVVAYNLYLQGRFRMYNDIANAKHYFEEAIARDPHFALAYDALAEYYWWAGFLGLAPPKETFAMGLWAALQALENDNTLADTHALLGMFRKEIDYNWSEVHREMALALELNPASSLARFRRALSGLVPIGRLDEAAAELENLLDSDPLNLEVRRWLGLTHWWRRDYERAIEQARLVLAVDPNYATGHVLVGVVRGAERKFDEAIAALRKAVELTHGIPVWLGWLGLPLAQSGEVAEARALLARLHATAEGAYVPASCFAWIHLGLDEIDEAFTWLDRAIDERDPMIVPIKSYEFFDSIRSDPRFAALLRKMNLEP